MNRVLPVLIVLLLFGSDGDIIMAFPMVGGSIGDLLVIVLVAGFLWAGVGLFDAALSYRSGRGVVAADIGSGSVAGCPA